MGWPCGKCDSIRHMDCCFGLVKDCSLLAAWLASVPMAAMLAAIKADKVVGEGTCSRIEECLGFGEDLGRELALAGIGTVEGALKWARSDEQMFLEQGLNQRWGEDDDEQLLVFREFEAADQENPV